MNLKITTIMNPPFGVQTRKADRFFLEKSFSFSDVIYSIHLAGEKTERFIQRFVKQHNWTIDYILPLNMVLERSFNFHTQKMKKINVNVYRLLK